MTDKELIQLYKMCSGRETCEGCSEKSDFDPCPIDRYCGLDDLIPRLEALLAENERLSEELRATERDAELLNHANAILKEQNEHLREVTKMVPKWVSVKERLPEMRQSEYDDIDGTHSRYQSEPVLGVDRAGDVAIVWHNRADWGESYWEDEPGNCYEITHWMPLPSTEGAE